MLEHRGPAPKRTEKSPKTNTQHYECSEGNAFTYIANKSYKIPVLLDSWSNIFLLNQQTAQKFIALYKTRQIPLKITAFNVKTSTTGGRYYTHPIKLEIEKNGHTTMVSCEIANAGRYDRIIQFGC